MSDNIKKNIWWQRYLAVIVFFFLVALYIGFDSGELSESTYFLDLVFWFISIIGVTGFVYDKQILHIIFWKTYLPLIIAWDLWIVFRNFSDGVEQPGGILVGAGFIVLLIKVPEYFALFYYAFRPNKFS